MLIGAEFTAFNQRLKISRSKEASNRQSKVLKVSKAGIRLRWNGRCVVMRSEWALTQSHIPLRELWPFKAAKIMAVMRLVRGYRRPYLLLGSGIWANISSRLCPEGTGSIAPPPPSLHREAAWPRSSQAAPSLYFSHLVRFTPSSGRAAPRQSAPSLYLLMSFSPIIPNSQKTGKPCFAPHWSSGNGCNNKLSSPQSWRRPSQVGSRPILPLPDNSDFHQLLSRSLRNSSSKTRIRRCCS
jgi:hypothetical protein